MNRKQRRAASTGRASIKAPATAEADALVNSGIGYHQAGRLADAEACYRRALAVHPDHADALHLLGLIAHQSKHYDAAVELIERALKLVGPNPHFLYNLAGVVKDQGRLTDAVALYRRAIRIKPDYTEAIQNCGDVLDQLNRPDEALASYDRALAFDPRSVQAHASRGNSLYKLQRLDEALASYDRALALKPDFAELWNNHACALRALKRFDEAVASCDRALRLKPDDAETWNTRGCALQDLMQFDEALACYDKALALAPGHLDACYNRGVALRKLGRLGEALKSFETVVARNPGHSDAFTELAGCRNSLCDWDHDAFAGGNGAGHGDDMVARLAARGAVMAPFTVLGCCGDPRLQLQFARRYSSSFLRSPARPLWTGTAWRHEKLRIAYLSADFQQHATSHLMAELFERHDRSRFEIIAVSFGVDDRSEMRRRLRGAFDQFHDVRRMSDEAIARLFYDRQIDIALDLKGYTDHARPAILACRPAPIQVNYLGYPGSMGTASVDYILTDKTVSPFEHQAFYTEKIVHLPDCYQVNDTKRRIADRTPTRREVGLPERGFVFCCFNNNFKIRPDVFDIWMRLLHQVEGSVLWLLRDNDIASQNLRDEARRRGIDAARLVFADRISSEQHLARHRLADLFLDTLPFNAHTTASDALWVGVPVVTRLGEAFAGRVAASLLRAIGLPELVTHSIEDYESLARQLATTPSLLQSYRSRLAANRLTFPLFDIDRFRRHIEAAYSRMWEICQRGEQPRSFAVEPQA